MADMDKTEWDERYRSAQLIWSAAPNQFVAELLADADPGRALDLACGEGRNALWLAERGWQVTAVDFSPVALAKAGTLAEARGLQVDWLAADVTEYQPAEGAYDLVLIVYLHLSADQISRVLHAAAAAVAPGGRLLLVGHDRDNLTEGVCGQQDPAVLHTVENVTAALGDLHIERAEQVRRTVEGSPRRAVDTLVLATRD
jgi:2-polyprenyl-3-methyl-5-hydroxy-6-metoxy-1,4-benzoquinol methylase